MVIVAVLWNVNMNVSALHLSASCIKCCIEVMF